MYQLTDTKVKKTKPGDRPVKLSDGHGLYLHVAPTGGKLWRFTYRFGGKQKLMALGVYPEVSLQRAREKHGDARKLLAEGIDPMSQRKAQRQEELAHSTTFQEVYEAWYERWAVGKNERHARQVKTRMESDILPAFGSKPVDDVDADDVRQMIIAVHERGAEDVARRNHAMKMDTPHIVPLSRQAVEVLRAFKLFNGIGPLVFPGEKEGSPLNKNTMLKAYERMGYKGRMTGHGWRGLASTILHEQGFEEAWIELQLAHQKRDKVSAAYDHAKYLSQRKKMMQWWADYLDEQRRKA